MKHELARVTLKLFPPGGKMWQKAGRTWVKREEKKNAI